MIIFKKGDEFLFVPANQKAEDAVTGSTVQWQQLVSEGTHVADITIDGIRTEVYAPSGMSADEVQAQIDEALADYTPTDGFATINGSGITEGGNIVIDGSRAYAKLERLEPHLYDITYDAIDYDYANDYFENKSPQPIQGGCTCVVRDGIVGRNYDWQFNDEVAFVVHTPAVEGRNKVDGVAGSLSALTTEVVARHGNEEAYKILPFMLQDGRNEHGLVCEVNVVPSSGTQRTVPATRKEDSVCALMLVRYILDKFGEDDSPSAIYDYLWRFVEVYYPQSMIDLGYELQFVISKANETPVIVATKNGQLQLYMMSGDIVVTNFRLNGTTMREHPYNTPYTANNGEFPRENGIEEYGTGIERANYAWNHIDSAHDEQTMHSLMSDLYFSNAYSDKGNDSWYSEFVGGSITVNTPSNEQAFQDRVSTYRQKWAERSRETGEVWITVHSSIYDLNSGRFTVYSQEESESASGHTYYINDDEHIQEMIDSALMPYNPTSNFKTINSQSIIGEGNIEIQGGGGEQNYVIVDSLDEIDSPYEGLVAYVRQRYEETFDVYSIDVSQTEGINDWFMPYFNGEFIYNTFYIRGGILSGDFSFESYTTDSPNDRIDLVSRPNEWFTVEVKDSTSSILREKGRLMAMFDGTRNRLQFAMLGFELTATSPSFNINYEGEEELPYFVKQNTYVYTGTRWVCQTLVINELGGDDAEDFVEYLHNHPDEFRYFNLFYNLHAAEAGYNYLKITDFEVRTDYSYGTDYFCGVASNRMDGGVISVYFRDGGWQEHYKKIPDPLKFGKAIVNENGQIIEGYDSFLEVVRHLLTYKYQQFDCNAYIQCGNQEEGSFYKEEMGRVDRAERIVTVDEQGEHEMIKFHATVDVDEVPYEGTWMCNPYDSSDYEILEWKPIVKTWFGSQSDYDDIANPDPNTLYYII